MRSFHICIRVKVRKVIASRVFRLRFIHLGCDGHHNITVNKNLAPPGWIRLTFVLSGDLGLYATVILSEVDWYTPGTQIERSGTNHRIPKTAKSSESICSATAGQNKNDFERIGKSPRE